MTEIKLTVEVSFDEQEWDADLDRVKKDLTGKSITAKPMLVEVAVSLGEHAAPVSRRIRYDAKQMHRLGDAAVPSVVASAASRAVRNEVERHLFHLQEVRRL